MQAKPLIKENQVNLKGGKSLVVLNVPCGYYGAWTFTLAPRYLQAGGRTLGPFLREFPTAKGYFSGADSDLTTCPSSDGFISTIEKPLTEVSSFF